MEWSPIILSLKLSTCTSILLLIISLPFTLVIKKMPFFIKNILKTIFSIPLILPSTVLGFYLLILFSPNNFLGNILKTYFSIDLLFSFTGLLIASMIYSTPFMIQPIMDSLEKVNTDLIEVSYTLGKSKIETFFKIVLPQIKISIITASIMTFAHTMGEFGVIFMIGGSIPGKTKVASIALFEEVESLQYNEAHKIAIVMLLISLVILFTVNLFNNSKKRRKKYA